MLLKRHLAVICKEGLDGLRTKLLNGIFIALCVGILFFLVAPVLVMIPLSFNREPYLVYPVVSYSLRWYHELFHAHSWLSSIKNSLIVAPAATLLAVVIGTPASIGLHQLSFPGKRLLIALLLSPMIVPVVITGLAMYLFLAPRGMANTYTGLVLSHALLGTPFVVSTVSATLEGYDFDLNRAASSLGAGSWMTFLQVMLPQIMPGVLSGAVFAFGCSFDEVVVTLFIASPSQATLPLRMFSSIRENITPTLAAAATILNLFAVCMLIVIEMLQERSSSGGQERIDRGALGR
jgi:putative spermidine/putrescine transport system permease protein